jgi:hypothetical protein
VEIIPSKTNFYSVIKGKTTDEINCVFQKINWAIRKSAISEYEYQCSWADLVLENDGEDLLLHGLVAYYPNNVKFIQELFDNLNCPYRFEFYNQNNLVIVQAQKDM